MHTDTETTYAVSRLIYLSLIYSNGSKRALAPYATEITELLQRLQAQDSFRRQVEAGLRAMDLRLLALEEGGLRLSARKSDSFFAATLGDYGKLLARREIKAAEILPVHCAIATAFFPIEADLDTPVEDLGAVILADVIDILRRFIHMEAALDPDEDILLPQLKTVADRLRQMPEDNPDRQRAGAGNSWVGLVTRVLEHMVETGYLLAFEEPGGDIEYRPTIGYQTAMREGIVYSFHAFRDFLIDSPEQEESTARGKTPKEKSNVSTQ